ncbi:hypothetical protein [Saccharopolyspora spinosa]|uniref:Uncharacterized protein n=1 Tax=Saccharopolyspora spinosa TaxID=60894 RepID=A0A2N3Y740_SACSN|nr:hypothetical protein [Saccharopolyspora spinosa]PKW18749.1 hypothetical protein A8926_6877 [Saccharopolyspora spinosa]
MRDKNNSRNATTTYIPTVTVRYASALVTTLLTMMGLLVPLTGAIATAAPSIGDETMTIASDAVPDDGCIAGCCELACLGD